MLSRDGRAAAPAVAPEGSGSRSCSNATTRATSRWSASTATDGPSESRTPTTRGIPRGRPTARHSRGTSGTFRTCRGTARESWRSRSMPPTGPRTSSRVATTSRSVNRGSRPVDDALAFVAEVDGWMRVWIKPAGDAPPHPLLDEAHEHAEPSWGPGQRSFAWSPDGTAIVLNRNEHGFGRLVRVALDGSAPVDVSKGWHMGLDWGVHGVACIRSGGRTAPQLTVLDPVSGASCVVATRCAGRPRRRRPPGTDTGQLDRRRRRDRPRTPVAARRRRPPTVPTVSSRPCWSTCTAAPPTRARSTGSRECGSSCRAAGPCSAPTTAARPGTATTTATRSTTSGGSSTSPTPSPAFAPPVARGGPTPRAPR